MEQMKFSANAARHVKAYLVLPCVVVTLFLSVPFSPQPAQAQPPPYPPSPVIESVTWDSANLVRLAPGSDLWPTTWAADGNIYTSWGDGGGFGGTNGIGRVSLGFARIEGSPPNFTTANVWGGRNPENTATFRGKSAGMLSVGGVLHALVVNNTSSGDISLAWSSDLGATWQKEAWTFSGATFAASTFLNFGRDYAGARDGFVYVYGGKWLTATPVYMARVPKDQIKNQGAYEFFMGLDVNGNPTWTSNITQRQPVFTDPNSTNSNGANHASVVYNPGLDRYILTVSHGGVGQLGIFDGPKPWGPWTTVAYYDNWGGFGTNVALPYYFLTKWISADGKSMWMVFSSTGVLDSFNLVKGTLTLRMPIDTTPPADPTGLKLN